MPRRSAPSRRAELERVKRGSLGQALLQAARLFDEQALAELREQTGIAWLRRSHTAVLPHIDFDGTRTSSIADRMGISKQAVNQVLDDLVSMGVVERTPDPEDGRASGFASQRVAKRRCCKGSEPSVKSNTQRRACWVSVTFTSSARC